MLHCPQIPAALRRDADETRARRARMEANAKRDPVDNCHFRPKPLLKHPETQVWPELAPLLSEAISVAAEPPPPDLTPQTLTARNIARAVGLRRDVTLLDIMSQRRGAKIARARQIAMYLTRTLTVLSLPQIGRALGGRDHTTAIHGCRKIAGLLLVDEILRADVAAIKAALGVVEEEQETPWPASGQ